MTYRTARKVGFLLLMVAALAAPAIWSARFARWIVRPVWAVFWFWLRPWLKVGARRLVC